MTEPERTVRDDLHHADGRHPRAVSVATLEFEAIDGGTRMTMTEQGTYLIDGLIAPKSRLEGTEGLFDQLGAELARAD